MSKEFVVLHVTEGLHYFLTHSGQSLEYPNAKTFANERAATQFAALRIKSLREPDRLEIWNVQAYADGGEPAAVYWSGERI